MRYRIFMGVGVSVGIGLSAFGAPSLTEQIAQLQKAPRTAARLADEARLSFYVARGLAAKDARRAWYVKGRDAGEAARQLDAQYPPATFWWAANVGAVAEIDRNLNAMADTARVVRVLEAFREQHPEWGYGAADRVLGAIYHAAPRFISVGSPSKAKAALQAALKRFPQYPGNRLGWAKFLRDEGREAEAVAIAREVRASADYARTDHGDFEPDRAVWDADLADLLGPDKKGAR